MGYSRELAKIAMHFEVNPLYLTQDQINEYLFITARRLPAPSITQYKFLVYSLRFMYRMSGFESHHIKLPKLKRDKRLPVILSRDEVRKMIDNMKSPKHKVLIMLLYGCGLRRNEIKNLRIEDLDFDRKLVHVRDGKNHKDRYVPISAVMIPEIIKYLDLYDPQEYLFNGRISERSDGATNHFSQYGIRWAIEQAARKAGIRKKISIHTLRHTYATHLLEDGLDIVSIKELLGHSAIETTLIYLHVAQYERKRVFSPMDNLYQKLERVECVSTFFCANYRSN